MGEKMDSERKAFFAWALKEGFQIKRHPANPERFDYTSTQCMWEAWQARAHITQPAQAVDVVAIREVIATLRACTNNDATTYMADKLTAALPKDSNGAEG